MPAYNFKNNLKSTLQAKLWSDATSIYCNHVVESEDADTRRNAWPAFPFTLTLVDTANDNVEVIKCTGLADNANNYIAFACARAQENTTAQTFEIATTSVEHRLTSGALNSITNATAPATTTARGIGRVATSADLVDGATITNGPAFLAAGVNTSVAAAAGKVPVSGSNNKLAAGWLPAIPPCITDKHLTSGSVTIADSRWYRFRMWGGGGSGGAGGNVTYGGLGGNAGGNTSVTLPEGAIYNGAVLTASTTVTANGGNGGGGSGKTCGGGGGGAGSFVEFWAHLTAGMTVAIVVGAGGVRQAGASSTANGTNGAGANPGIAGAALQGGGGAPGAGSGSFYMYDGTLGGVTGPGGNGAVNALPYGNGGGGGGGTGDRAAFISAGGVAMDGAESGGKPSTTTTTGYGGKGGDGAILIDYFKEAA